MTYKEARAFIEESNQYGSKLGLEAITELLRRLNEPQNQLRVIHVAGTNGKGSTTAFIATILSSAGYVTGRYISPAVFDYRERVQISRSVDGTITTEYITEEGITAAITEIRSACEEMVKEGYSHPTSFEIETAMAFLYLAWQKVDFAVIEVGMGGRLDATNVFRQPLLSIITSISLDHMQYLGDTLDKIAAEKAGIIKSGVPVITGNTQPEVYQVIREVSERQSSELILARAGDARDIVYSPEGTEFTYYESVYRISLLGEYQVANAILAIRAVEKLKATGVNIDEKDMKDGLLQTRWSGRLELLAREPYFLMDGAHNEDAAMQLHNAILKLFPNRRLIAVMGVLADKDYPGILRIMAPLMHTLITLTPENSRALSSGALAEEAKKYCICRVIDAGSAEQAIREAYQLAEKKDVIIAFGSLSYLGEVKKVLNQTLR